MSVKTDEKYEELVRVAEDLYQQNPQWDAFFREILGVKGAVRRAFPDSESLAQFEKSEQYDRIHQMLAKLRARRRSRAPHEEGSESPEESREPTRMITVRLPQSMHALLQHEAHERHTTMNKLCISKLLQIVDEQLVPESP